MTQPDGVDETPLERSQDAIDAARDAAKKVADAEDIEPDKDESDGDEGVSADGGLLADDPEA